MTYKVSSGTLSLYSLTQSLVFRNFTAETSAMSELSRYLDRNATFAVVLRTLGLFLLLKSTHVQWRLVHWANPTSILP